MSLLTHIHNALKNRTVKSPFAVDISELAKYIAETQYQWEWSPEGDVGTLDRGFGRTYVVKVDKRNPSITVTAQTDFQFLFITRKSSASKTFGADQISEKDFYAIEEAINEHYRNAPESPRVTLAVVLLLLLLLVVHGGRRN